MKTFFYLFFYGVCTFMLSYSPKQRVKIRYACHGKIIGGNNLEMIILNVVQYNVMVLWQ